MITDLTLPARLEPTTLAALDPEPDDAGPRVVITWQPDRPQDLPGRVALGTLVGQTLTLDLHGTPIACRIVAAAHTRTHSTSQPAPDGLLLTVELVGRFRVLDQPGATSPSDPATGHTIPAPLAQPFRPAVPRSMPPGCCRRGGPWCGQPVSRPDCPRDAR